jgi:hypothetical protein
VVLILDPEPVLFLDPGFDDEPVVDPTIQRTKPLGFPFGAVFVRGGFGFFDGLVEGSLLASPLSEAGSVCFAAAAAPVFSGVSWVPDALAL